MDNLRLQKLIQSGVEVQREPVRVVQPKIDLGPLSSVLEASLGQMVAALAQNGQVSIDLSALANAMEGQGQEMAKAVSRIKPSVAVNHPKLKKIKFTVTRRDELGNLVGFEAEPEYES